MPRREESIDGDASHEARPEGAGSNPSSKTGEHAHEAAVDGKPVQNTRKQVRPRPRPCKSKEKSAEQDNVETTTGGSTNSGPKTRGRRSGKTQSTDQGTVEGSAAHGAGLDEPAAMAMPEPSEGRPQGLRRSARERQSSAVLKEKER